MPHIVTTDMALQGSPEKMCSAGSSTQRAKAGEPLHYRR